MDCRACGADLPHHAAFCLQCGARVELGSVLGVGTDLPPVPPRDQAAPGPAPEPQHQPAEDLSRTAELPRVSVPAPEPHTDGLGHTDDPRGADGSGHSRGSILAMVATFVALTVIGTFALTRILGSDAPESQAATPSATVQDESAPTGSSPGASPSTSPTPATGSPTPTSTESGASIPAGARRCSTEGSDAVATAYAATERTSCEFAAAVRGAYREAGSPVDATSLRAFSPVTKKWYSLTCDGGAPVRCTSTTNAVVLLAP